MQQPIPCVVEIRHGAFGGVLRRRKGLAPTSSFAVTTEDTFTTLVAKIESVLPSSFTWNIKSDPPRYQRIKEQPQYSLQTVPEDNFYEIFREIIERDKRLLNYRTNLKIWIYGSWSRARDRDRVVTEFNSNKHDLDSLHCSANTLVNMNDQQQTIV